MSVSSLAIVYLYLAPILAVVWLIIPTSDRFGSLALDGALLPRGFDRVRWSLGLLLRRGFANGVMTIGAKKVHRLIPFRKYIHAKGDYGLELNFPDTIWSKAYFPKVRAYCEESGLSYRIDTNISHGRMPVLAVDCGRDLDKAVELATAVWTRVFGLSTDAHYTTSHFEYDRWSGLVDDPDQRPPSPQEQLRIMRQKGLPSFSDVGLATVLVFVFLASLVALPVTTLASLGEPPDWSLELAGLTMRGSTASLWFASLFAFSFAALRFFGKRLQVRSQPMNFEGQPRLYLPRWLCIARDWALTALMAAVIVVWFTA